MVWKTPATTIKKDQRTGDRMQEDRIQTTRPYGRRGSAIGCAGANVVRPAAALRNILQHRKLDARRGQRSGAGRGSFHELEDLFDALPFGGADQRNRRAEFTGELGRIHLAAAALQIVRHVEDHQRRQLQAENRRGQHQMAAQVGAIQDQEQRVGLGDAGHGAGQNVAGHLFVFRARVQAVNAGQIDQHDVAIPVMHPGFADALFHGDARKIGHLLSKTCQAIEKRGLAGVRRTDDGDDVRPSCFSPMKAAVRQPRNSRNRGSRS